MNKIKYLLVFLGMAILAIVWTVFLNNSDLIVKKSKQDSSISTCLNGEEKLTVNEPHLKGILECGTTVSLIKNFHECSPLKKGDLVYFRYHSDQNPVVRIVKGIPGDRFEVIKDPNSKGWKIKVNGDFLKVGKNEDLVYGAPDFIPPLGLAANSRQNIVGENEVILLTNSHSGKFDSTLMGLISINDIVGKIIIPDTKN